MMGGASLHARHRATISSSESVRSRRRDSISGMLRPASTSCGSRSSAAAQRAAARTSVLTFRAEPPPRSADGAQRITDFAAFQFLQLPPSQRRLSQDLQRELVLGQRSRPQCAAAGVKVPLDDGQHGHADSPRSLGPFLLHAVAHLRHRVQAAACQLEDRPRLDTGVGKRHGLGRADRVEALPLVLAELLRNPPPNAKRLRPIGGDADDEAVSIGDLQATGRWRRHG
jgi:hypothetical protein